MTDGPSGSPAQGTAPAAAASAPAVPWYEASTDAVCARLGVAVQDGLASGEASTRLATYGRNELPTEPPPSVWKVAGGQLSNPMNIMLLIVGVASFAIGQIATGVVVTSLVTFNVVMGSNQELKARASVEALASLQVPAAKVRRDGAVVQVEATSLVPGDVVLLEAGDVVPADGRVVTSATLELQEAALTGESAPISKDALPLPGEAALGDRTNMVFQNTAVTRGTATIVVTATGVETEMGHIATMVTETKRTKSPLQRELDGMTKVFGLVAWLAVLIIALFGIARGQTIDTLLLLCISTAISAIPTGLPTFVQTMLSSGARRLAESKAVVKTLTDVETLGGTTVINSDKTGTLTMNAMTATTLLAGGDQFHVEGGGYKKVGSILGVAGGEAPDFRALALGLALSSDATVGDDESVVGDPTEAALVVLAAKMGVDAEETRRAIPRRAEVPFDSTYKFMATYHDTPAWVSGPVVTRSALVAVKGAPDVVIERCDRALWHGRAIVPIEQVRDELLRTNQELSEQGLRVLAFAAKDLDASELPRDADAAMAGVSGLVLIGLVGIIDPLRAEAKHAVDVALNAGIDVRMITGDHTVTARAIADQLGLGVGVITGSELQQLGDDEVIARLPELHVFGRVAPEDKVRLARLMQESGQVVAMTGDAVNDAAALKQADIGVAMGSGSEVTKQAAKIVLTDDNFATLVRAVDLGRDIYRRISSYVKLQLTILSSVLQLMLLATIFNVNQGVALFPMQLLFCKFFVVVTVVVGFIADVPDPSVMQQPPREPGTRIVNPPQVVRWLLSGFIVAMMALAILEWGPDQPSTTHASLSMTMAFALVALTAVNLGVVMRREREAPWSTPMFPYFAWLMAGWTLTWAAVELGMLQRLLGTTSLSGREWVIVLALSMVTPGLLFIDKLVRQRSQGRASLAARPAHAAT